MLDYLITGGNGFIGKNLTDFLTFKGKLFKTIDLNPDPCSEHDNICMDSALHLPSIEAKTLVHLASETNVRKSVKEPVFTIRRNVYSVLNCLELLRGRAFESMMFTSSANSRLSMSPYLASKNSCESICKAYRSSYGVDIKIIKLSNVYGPYSIHKHSVIPTFIRNCIDQKPLIIFGDGSQSRDFVYVGDVVSAIYDEKEGIIASGETFSIKTIAFMISDLSLKLTGYIPKVVYEPAFEGEVVKAIKGTDIVSSTSFEEGLDITFKWFLENYEPERLEQARSRARRNILGSEDS